MNTGRIVGFLSRRFQACVNGATLACQVRYQERGELEDGAENTAENREDRGHSSFLPFFAGLAADFAADLRATAFLGVFFFAIG
jgi:hypothetical protein